MRQILFHIPLDRPLPLGPLGSLPIFGFGLLLVVWVLLGIRHLYGRIKEGRGLESDDLWSAGWWLAISALLMFAPEIGGYLRQHGTPPFRDGLPVFGYGFMLFIAVASGGWIAARRAIRHGLSPDKIWDLVFCLFLSGIAGARVFYLVQYRDRVFEHVSSPIDFVIAVVNLSNGGIVLYGGLIAASVAYFVYCNVNHIRPLALLDIITPSIFVGIGFGRIGCFLNGCCYGDQSTLPWAVSFPQDSATFGALVEKGLIQPDALCTPPLHPTQIYSAIDGFVLAALTAWYFSRRRRNGEVFAIGLLIYPITRFLIEFIRGDEPGLFGTRFTISQWISAGMFLVAIGYLTWLSRRPAVLEPLCEDPVPSATGGKPASIPPAHAAAR